MTKRPKTRGTRGTGNRSPPTEAQLAARFKPGSNANPGGKPKMPDWLYHAGPSALAMQVAAGTGRVVEIEGDSVAEMAARTQMALLAPATIRQAAGAVIIDRVYGKVKEQVEHSGDLGARTVLEVRFVGTDDPKVIDVLSPKQLSDAE